MLDLIVVYKVLCTCRLCEDYEEMRYLSIDEYLQLSVLQQHLNL